MKRAARREARQRSLRRKAIRIIAVTMAVLCAALGGMIAFFSLSGYFNMEREEVRNEVERARKGLLADEKRIASIAGDWAPWDETYDYVLGKNPKYEADNLDAATVANLKINLFAILNGKGSFVVLRRFDLESQSFLPPLPEVPRLSSDDPLLRHADIRSGADGLVRFGAAGLMLVSSRAITTSDMRVAPVGSLIVGLALDRREAAALSDRLSLDIGFLPNEGSGVPRETAEARAQLPSADSIYVKAIDFDRVAGYAPLRDLEGNTVAFLKVSLSRGFFHEGLVNLLLVFVALCIMAIISTLAVIFIVDRLILDRVSRLGREIARVGNASDPGARVELDGDDEFANLASIANTGLSRLDEAHRALIASLREKNLLLREIHHRVKNNLQIISSLLNLQAGTMRDSLAEEALRESENRINSMALVHELLYQHGDNGRTGTARVEFLEYMRQISASLAASYSAGGNRVEVTVEGEEVELDADTAICCALIVNELTSNALKHAFPEGRAGRVVLSARADGSGNLTLSVKDNGVGLPSGFDAAANGALGLHLVTALSSQINGSFEIDGEAGCEGRIRLRLAGFGTSGK
ncbi:MAG TPA: CHASE4 domain-containing protein [Rectinemataceae bacterium]|nr:CHASE4 domain-containing protein [Rectinemataceae bacterium]